jgi:hypothetical protein
MTQGDLDTTPYTSPISPRHLCFIGTSARPSGSSVHIFERERERKKKSQLVPNHTYKADKKTHSIEVTHRIHHPLFDRSVLLAFTETVQTQRSEIQDPDMQRG